MEDTFVFSVMDILQISSSVYGAVAVWLGVFLLGETGILAAFALSAQGHISPQVVAMWAFLGSLSADVFWYWMIEKIIKKPNKKYFQKLSSTKTEAIIVRLTDSYTFFILTFIKFLIGIRLFLTFYIVLKKHIPFRTYLSLNSLGTVFFIAALFPVGWFLGKGVSSVLFLERGLLSIVSVVVLTLLFSQILRRVLAFVLLLMSKRVD
jgi:membrane protein DedA with SNARE-associated domain